MPPSEIFISAVNRVLPNSTAIPFPKTMILIKHNTMQLRKLLLLFDCLNHLKIIVYSFKFDQRAWIQTSTLQKRKIPKHIGF
jgi:hypothetical protein